MITAAALAAHLHVTTDYIYRLARAGKIPAIRVGNRWRFDLAEVTTALKVRT